MEAVNHDLVSCTHLVLHFIRMMHSVEASGTCDSVLSQDEKDKGIINDESY